MASLKQKIQLKLDSINLQLDDLLKQYNVEDVYGKLSIQPKINKLQYQKEILEVLEMTNELECKNIKLVTGLS